MERGERDKECGRRPSLLSILDKEMIEDHNPKQWVGMPFGMPFGWNKKSVGGLDIRFI